MGDENFELPCFFCNKGIKSVKKAERRSYYDHYDKYFVNVDVVVPVEEGAHTITFEPQYIVLLKYEIYKAGKEIEQIIEAAKKVGHSALKPHAEKLADVLEGVELVITEHVTKPQGWSPEHFADRAESCYSNFSENRFATYRNGWIRWYDIEGVDEVKPAGFKAHNSCIKPEITLEEFVNTPLIKARLQDSFESQPLIYKKIFDKLKYEKIKIIAQKFDFRDYLKEDHEFG